MPLKIIETNIWNFGLNEDIRSRTNAGPPLVFISEKDASFPPIILMQCGHAHTLTIKQTNRHITIEFYYTRYIFAMS